MFVDTSGMLCCLDATDALHAAATILYDAASMRMTHNYVVAEFVALGKARRLHRRSVLQAVAAVAQSSLIELVWVDAAIHETALSLLQSQMDKTYSLCDAVSFVLMRQRGIAEALTTDHHFEQAGFVRLLK